MSENILLNIGVKFSVSLNMAENLCLEVCIITYECGENELPISINYTNMIKM